MPRRVTVPGPPTCGNPSSNRYRGGCRCDECRAANTARQRAYFAAKGGNRWRNAEREARIVRERRAAGWRQNRDTPGSRAHSDRRRLQKLATTVERFTHAEIFERDCWLCGICEKPVDPELRYPDPMSASLDHVEPLSLGGTHTRENVRCSHLTCNVARGNRAA